MLKSFERPLDYLTKAIKNGNLEQGMPTFQQVLGEEQIAGLSKYIKNFDYEANHLAATKTDRSYEIEVVVDDLEIPWGMEFLLNGDMLITEKEGTLSRFSKANGLQEIKGLLAVRNSGQGGLLDVKAHPNYEENGWVYLSYSYVDENNSGRGNAAIIRAKIESNTLTGIDEINIIQKGTNYGWPVISYGINYRGTTFTDITEKEGMEQPIHYYVPSIAPCGMDFLTSDVYPAWKNNLIFIHLIPNVNSSQGLPPLLLATAN